VWSVIWPAYYFEYVNRVDYSRTSWRHIRGTWSSITWPIDMTAAAIVQAWN